MNKDAEKCLTETAILNRPCECPDGQRLKKIEWTEKVEQESSPSTSGKWSLCQLMKLACSLFNSTANVFLYYLIILSNSYSIGCKTKAVKEAPKQNEDCQFPFQYNGQSYSNCTNIDFGVVFWCSTEANATDNNWGVCEDSCPKEKIGNII